MSETGADDNGFSWKTYLESLAVRVGTSSVKQRCELLETEVIGHVVGQAASDKEVLGLVVVLKKTIPLYVDRVSRAAVHKVLASIGAQRPQTFGRAMAVVLDGAMETAQPRKTTHPDAIPSTQASRFVMLTWATQALDVYTREQGSDASDAVWKRLVLLTARLLWGIAPAHAQNIDRKAMSMSRSAHREVWRVVRAHPEAVGSMLDVLTAKADESETNAVLLGNVVSAGVRVAKAAVVERKPVIADFIDRVLISAKATPSYSSVRDMQAFLELIGSEFDQMFRPTISRMLVRSPEAVLPTCLWLVQAVGRDNIDLAPMYLEAFAEPLAGTQLRSANEGVRGAAAQLLAYLGDTPKTQEDAERAADVITRPLTLGRYTQTEQRTAAYVLLSGVRAGPGNGWASSAVILTALLKMTGKETQEAPVNALFAAIGAHFGVLIDQQNAERAECAAVIKTFAEAAQKGLALPDRSAVVRQAWAADAIGEPLWAWADAGADSESPLMRDYVQPLLVTLAATAEKATAAPLAVGGGTLGAHVGLALALRLRPAGVDVDALAQHAANGDKSLVMWDKVFHKCSRRAECVWVLRCAEALFARGCSDKRLADPALWIACRMPGATLETVRAAIDVLATMSRTDAARLWRIVGETLFTEMDRSAPVAPTLCTWADVLHAVLTGAGAAELAAAALTCHHPQASHVGGTSLWISLVQRAGVDPAELWHAHSYELEQAVMQALDTDASTDTSTSTTWRAAEALAADLVLVGGNGAAQRLLDQAHTDIDPEALRAICAEDIAVWRTPADQLFFDPVAASASDARRPPKGDDAWVEEIQRAVALRKNIPRKLSPAEQLLVTRRREVESAMRQRVEQAARGLRRGLAIVRAAVAGSASVAAANMLTLMRVVVDRAVRGGSAAATLAGDAIVDALMELVTCADGLDPVLRAPVAMGLLRARGFAVPAAWEQEPMAALASRVLYRLRAGCERTPLAAAGFNFVLPLMQATADAGGWGGLAASRVAADDEYAPTDPAAEQLALVVDILAFHAHFGFDEAMPRREMLQLLIQLMSTRPTLLAASRACLEQLASEMEGSDGAAERAVLDGGLAQADSAVRGACLAALDFADMTDAPFSAAVWVNMGGRGTESVPLEENGELAATLWEDNGMEVQPALITAVVPFLRSEASELRTCAARAVGAAVETLAGESNYEQLIDRVLSELKAAYGSWLVRLEPDYDEFGIVVPGTQHRTDIAYARVAVADALYHVAPLLATSAQAQALVRFLVDDGVLGERAETVRTRMLDAGARAVESHGAAWAGELMPLLERELAARDRGTTADDHVREGVVVLLGRLAQHLPPSDDARVEAAVDRLLAALSTPSESVQSAVGQCLAPLARRLSDTKLASAVEHVMSEALSSERYAARRGGAYGLAGLIKGRGLAALKRFSVVDRLREASEDRKDMRRREGALFAYETLAAAMGRLFEPYVIQFVPTLLALFGDPSADVRDAAQETARVIMAGISGHGVKLLLPAALHGLDDSQWRTKKGSVEMLGAMAYCAPKQLSMALPSVVPRIIEVLTDTHGQVADSARRALLRFGEVIHNPEIQDVVPTLLAALDDPASKTDAALRTLLFTAFVHYIDAPSLALVVPILQRGMRARAAKTKRNAAQIMGSMATLTDPADLAPYLPSLVPLLRTVLVDPVPEARATAAKALGSLVQRLREERFPTLVADLVAVLKSDASGVDRAGAAQGLSEVLSGIGLSRLEGLLPEITANCSSARAPVREGFMMLLIYLPTTFAEEFQPFLSHVLPSVLAGLADENEQVRAAALRAGRILVASFARSAVDQLLPELLASMHHEAWRIRHSSIELLGELIYRVAGITGNQAEREREALRASFAVVSGDGDEESDEEEEEAVSANLREVLSEELGVDRCHEILAALYVARSDVAAMVRQMSFSVWKTVVANTPRTVRECLPQIMDIVLVGLASDAYERRTTAARTLGDLVHKLGEAVMSRVVPILEGALRGDTVIADGGGSIRHGVFIGLSEILNATGKAYMDAYADAMIPLVRRGLCDADEMVREAAAAAFNGLQQTVGPRVIDSVVPPLLNALTQNTGELDGIDPEHALEALRELMAVRANVVFPVLIPTLTAVPITLFNARALSSLIQVSGATLSRRLPQILLALFESLPVHHASGDTEAEAGLRDTVRVIVSTAAQDESTLESLMLQFHESVKVKEGADLSAAPKDASRVAEACYGLATMCQSFAPNSAARGRTAMGAHVIDWLRILIDLLASSSQLVVEASWAALDALCKIIPKDDYDGYVGPVSRAVLHATESLPKEQKTLPGFNLPKGVGPLLPIYSQGLLTGSSDTKERAVRGMARLVRFTEPTALRLFATGITGPLIRIVGDRHPPNVKAAILSTLGLLLTQVPALMRPFLPQLQRTFVRGLSEADDTVRRRAAAALAALIPLQPRLDPLVAELTTGIKQTEEQGMKNAMMKAVVAVVGAPNAQSLSAVSIQAIESATTSQSNSVDPRWQQLRSQAFGALCGVVPDTAASQLVSQHAMMRPSDPAPVQATKLHCLAAVLCESPALFAQSADLQSQTTQSVSTALTPNPDNVHQALVSLPATRVAKNALLSSKITPLGSPNIPVLVDALVRVVDPSTMASFDSDTQHAALVGLKAVAKHRFDVLEPMRDTVVMAVMAHVRGRNITVKLAAERCALYALRLARVPSTQFDGDNNGLDAYVLNMGGPASDKGKQVLDYHRRVLNKLADATRELDYASDDEDDPSSVGSRADGANSDDEA
ncbi:translational activator of GCN4 [Coemansia sp. RSA 1822]|nr:translational activator of GCN4 [Coemansia sp. RSA 1853]KAJ2561053.1 translational activator of GCN4 [Coemansia sp. RSA 1822]